MPPKPYVQAPTNKLEIPLATDESADAASPPAGEIDPRAAAPPRAGLAQRLSSLGQRRTFLVNTRSQLRAGFLTATCALVLLLLLNLSLYSARRSVTEGVLADSPELGRILHAQNRVELALVVTASLVFLVGVFVVTVLETHKTAGAAYNLARHMVEIEHGQYGARVRLRKDDNLRELEATFNSMSGALQRRAWRDADQLEELALAAEQLTGPDEARDLARRLRTHAEQLRHTAG